MVVSRFGNCPKAFPRRARYYVLQVSPSRLSKNAKTKNIKRRAKTDVFKKRLHGDVSSFSPRARSPRACGAAPPRVRSRSPRTRRPRRRWRRRRRRRRRRLRRRRRTRAARAQARAAGRREIPDWPSVARRAGWTPRCRAAPRRRRRGVSSRKRLPLQRLPLRRRSDGSDDPFPSLLFFLARVSAGAAPRGACAAP